MEKEKIINHLADEVRSILNAIGMREMLLTDILINNLHKIKYLSKSIKELTDSKDINLLIQDYKREILRIEVDLINEDIPIQQTFLNQVYRLKVIKEVVMLAEENKDKINKPGYVK